jgi:TonB family protein
MATSGSLQFALLPEGKVDSRALAVSYGSVLLLLFALAVVGMIFPERLLIRQRYELTDLVPRPDVEPAPIKVKPRPKVEVQPPPVPLSETPKLIVPREIRRPRPEQTEVPPPTVKLDNLPPPVLNAGSDNAKMAKVVHTGEFSSPPTATLRASASKVQTGGFGDPNGLPGQGNPGAHLSAANVGAFDLPLGPGIGNGTGGASGLKGTIANAGFGNTDAQSVQVEGHSHGGVQTAGFATQQVAQAGTKTQPLDKGSPTTPVEITYKPNPIYTDEARQLKLEGEVLLEVMFGANGQLHVNRVIRGLGHGLDEAAVGAANQMRFKPALRDGQPVDSTAVVYVVFQLAS